MHATLSAYTPPPKPEHTSFLIISDMIVPFWHVGTGSDLIYWLGFLLEATFLALLSVYIHMYLPEIIAN